MSVHLFHPVALVQFRGRGRASSAMRATRRSPGWCWGCFWGRSALWPPSPSMAGPPVRIAPAGFKAAGKSASTAIGRSVGIMCPRNYPTLPLKWLHLGKDSLSCPHCDTELSEEVARCPKCGGSITWAKGTPLKVSRHDGPEAPLAPPSEKPWTEFRNLR